MTINMWKIGGGKHQASQSCYICFPRKQKLPFLTEIFPWKSCMKSPKKSTFVTETIYCNRKTETNFLHKKSLCHRNKFPSQKQLSSEFLSETPTSVTEKSLFIKRKVCLGQKFLSKKKRLSQKQVDRTLYIKTPCSLQL